MKTNVFPRIFAALVLFAALFACQKPDDETIPVLKVPQPMILATGGSQSLEVASTVAWTLSVEYGGTSTGWIKLSQTSGEAAIGVKIQMTVDPNGGENRRATLVLKGTTLSTSVEISQMGTSVSDAPLWLELPALDRAGFLFGTHDMKGGAYAGAGKSGVRNYSFYWDPNGRVSFWVAYPLNKDLCGTGNYTYDWTQAYDPMVPQDQQPNLTEHSYGGRGWDGEYWNRGHQMPRADRQLTQESVMSTCRTTNITPQCSSFNGGIWGDLEVWVRGRARDPIHGPTTIIRLRSRFPRLISRRASARAAQPTRLSPSTCLRRRKRMTRVNLRGTSKITACRSRIWKRNSTRPSL